MPNVVTANRLTDGIVVYLAADGEWTEEIAEARVADTEEETKALEAEAEQAEKILPRVLSFVVTPEQEKIIELAVEQASDGTPGRDRKSRGLANLAQHFLEGRSDG